MCRVSVLFVRSLMKQTNEHAIERRERNCRCDAMRCHAMQCDAMRCDAQHRMRFLQALRPWARNFSVLVTASQVRACRYRPFVRSFHSNSSTLIFTLDDDDDDDDDATTIRWTSIEAHRRRSSRLRRRYFINRFVSVDDNDAKFLLPDNRTAFDSIRFDSTQAPLRSSSPPLDAPSTDPIGNRLPCLSLIWIGHCIVCSISMHRDNNLCIDYIHVLRIFIRPISFQMPRIAGSGSRGVRAIQKYFFVHSFFRGGKHAHARIDCVCATGDRQRSSCLTVPNRT
jgi:hypothetical protein